MLTPCTLASSVLISIAVSECGWKVNLKIQFPNAGLDYFIEIAMKNLSVSHLYFLSLFPRQRISTVFLPYFYYSFSSLLTMSFLMSNIKTCPQTHIIFLSLHFSLLNLQFSICIYLYPFHFLLYPFSLRAKRAILTAIR